MNQGRDGRMTHRSLSWQHLTMAEQAALKGGQSLNTNMQSAGAFSPLALQASVVPPERQHCPEEKGHSTNMWNSVQQHTCKLLEFFDTQLSFVSHPPALQGQNCVALPEDGSIIL